MKNLLFSFLSLCTFLSLNANAENMCPDASSSSSSGSLYDSGGPGAAYGKNEACTFLIQPNGASEVTLTFSEFDLKNKKAYVELYDGDSASSAQIANLTNKTGGSYTATSGAMFVRFVSTKDKQDKSGFEATWSSNSCDTGTLSAVGISIDGGGSNSQIGTTTEALAIYAAWLAAGSPASGLIDSGTYNVAASGSSTVDRIDFGGSDHDFSGTLPYPGAAAGVSGSDFLVHTSGTLSLPAGDYTIYVESDDGFSFVMNTLSGDTVSFNKFGSSSGESNELRFENPTANSNTGGVFTLRQDSVFDIAAIFYERGGGDYLEISIANNIRTSGAPAGYEILREGAIRGKVIFGQCATPAPVPLLEYRFEESNWNGSPGEILDNTGNGFAAQVGNNSTPETATPALPGNSGTCGYASQNDGSIQVTGLPLDTTTNGVKTTVTFWMSWDGTNNVMPLGWGLHDIWMVSGSMGFNTFNSDIYGISSAGLANGWHHVAVEFTNGNVASNRMHIDGVEQVLTQQQSSPNNARAFVNSEMRVGGISNSTGYDFHGLLDEFRVYESALTTAQVETIMAETHACGNTPIIHHYEIIHDGQGLTCDTELVTVKACTDASCSNLNTQPVTLDFLADGALVSSPAFTGSTTVSVNNTVVETLTFSVADASVAVSNPLVCDDGGGNSCDMAFTAAGFRFLSGAGNSAALPNQTSGAVFGDTLKLQAVKDTDGVCTGLFAGNTNVDLSQENVGPGGSSGLNFSIDGNNIAKHPGITSTLLNFGDDSIAIIPRPVYRDAGQIRLYANYDVGGVTLSGSSNAFWVSPAELVVSAKSGAASLNGATATATPIHKAGENFDFSITALNSLGVITPNYSPGQIQLKLTRTGPTLTDSVDGNLSYAASNALAASTSAVFQNITLTDFSSGVSTYNAAQYSEVGLLNLDAQDSNYGNASIVIPAATIDIGRFIPDHFTQTVADNGFFLATCNSTTTFAAYSGQKDEATNSKGAISYLTNPVLAITAYNKQGDITENYYQDSQGSVNDYMKLSAADISVTVPASDQVAIGIDANKLSLTANMNTGTLSQNDLTAFPSIVALPKGVLHYQLSDNDNYFYNRSANAIVAPFTSDIDFSTAAISDADNVNVTTTVDASPAGIEIRFGRLLLKNSFGPETSNFPQPMQLEYFDGTVFIVASDDNCSRYDASKISLTNISLDSALTGVLGGVGSFLAGNTQAIELESPGSGNQGKIGVLYNASDWLKYDWNNDGAYDNSPSAVATFGVFRGNDKIIYQLVF
jgi:MSHA biogenesis protein MshQ